MKKHVFLIALVLGGVSAGQVLKILGRERQVQTERPNIVFMLCDDMRYDRIVALNSYDTDLQTPHLDQLVTDDGVQGAAISQTPGYWNMGLRGKKGSSLTEKKVLSMGYCRLSLYLIRPPVGILRRIYPRAS